MSRRNCTYAEIGCNFEGEENDVQLHEEDKAWHLSGAVVYCQRQKNDLARTNTKLQKIQEAYSTVKNENVKLTEENANLKIIIEKLQEELKYKYSERQSANNNFDDTVDNSVVNNEEGSLSQIDEEENNEQEISEEMEGLKGNLDKNYFEATQANAACNEIEESTLHRMEGDEQPRLDTDQLKNDIENEKSVNEEYTREKISELENKLAKVSGVLKKFMFDKQYEAERFEARQAEILQKWNAEFEKEKVKLLAIEQKNHSMLTDQLNNLRESTEQKQAEIESKLLSVMDDLQIFPNAQQKSSVAFAKIPSEEKAPSGAGSFQVYYWNIGNFSTVMQDLQSNKIACCRSETFTSHPGGYELCLKLRFALTGVYLDLCIVRGTNDNLLTWPTIFKVTTLLANQKTSQEHLEKHFTTRRIDKPTETKYVGNSSFFISHSQIYNEKYLVNDVVQFRCIIHK